MEDFSCCFKVRAHCATYNHVHYITDTMNGFVMQETDFPYVCTIIDDASTDGEQEVIKKYLLEQFDMQDSSVAYEKDTDYGHVTFAQHKTNKNCFFAVVFLKENHYSQHKTKASYVQEWMNTKYVSICEGDDYWTDPLKLQKQVDFLEQHEDYVVCSHDYVKYYTKDSTFDKHSFYYSHFQKVDESVPYLDYSLNNYFVFWWTHPLSCVYRNGEYIKKIPREKYKFFRDNIFFYYVLKQGKGALLRDIMGVYRIQEGGIWSSLDMVERHRLSVINAYCIYKVEGDERAFIRMNSKEYQCVTLLINTHRYWDAVKELLYYKRLVPRACFSPFRKRLNNWIAGKIKKRI